MAKKTKQANSLITMIESIIEEMGIQRSDITAELHRVAQWGPVRRALAVVRRVPFVGSRLSRALSAAEPKHPGA